MAGSIKIQHGGTASTPQAGFSTLWVKSSDGEFYYTKPNGSSASLVGENGATGTSGTSPNYTATSTDTVTIGTGLKSFNASTGRSFTPGQYVVAANSGSFYMTGPITVYNPTTGILTINVQNTVGSGTYSVWFINLTAENGAQGATGTVNAYYGNFLSTVSQPNAGATAANAITYNTTDLTSGVSVVSSSRITVANAGIYNIEFSAQLQKASGGDDQVDIWLAKNGSNVANSNTTIMMHSNPGYEVAAWNFLVQANAADYYELYWSSADTTAEIHAAAAGINPTRPAIPSVILSVTQVSTA